MTVRQPPRGGSPSVINAIRVDGKAAADPDGFTYTILIDPKPVREPDDRRDAPRRRTRLRSGKVVDSTGTFVTECVVHDLSSTGVRLRLPPDVALPAAFQVYDDQSGLLQNAEVSWRRDGEAGVRFTLTEETPRSRIIAADMRRRFYKMPR
ncbi:PilZ domain-containing protein [Lichenifustis flavocetrariae]|uniref:PilZ domain-containing protein n=1 Tax=Lichenifustis flavocetrariae TaxID=2949735 RepID=A0AA41YU46_9HYPH|nr:PilZ domain-containing protein [Lichenifustis flavocetrariae]MCW6507350.1 PilZ domain-containing protein [Lichenifustis flavocetrariae]